MPQRFSQLPAGARVAGYLTQLRRVVKELGLPINSTPSDYCSVHTALLTGLLSHIGQKDADKQEFTGARNARFSIFPGSGLFKSHRSGPWWPNWWKPAACGDASPRASNRNGIEPLAQHLVKHSYSRPHWSKSQGAVMASKGHAVWSADRCGAPGQLRRHRSRCCAVSCLSAMRW